MFFQAPDDLGGLDLEFVEQTPGNTVGRLDHGQQQMLRVHLGMTQLDRSTVRCGQGVLGFLGQSVGIHSCLRINWSVLPLRLQGAYQPLRRPRAENCPFMPTDDDADRCGMPQWQGSS